MPDASTQTENEKHKELKKLELKNINTLILSGGFISGYNYIGFIKYLHNTLEQEQINKQFTTFIASSAGGLISLILILNYSYQEIEYITYNHKFNNYENFDYLNILNFNKNYGFDNGEKFSHLLKNIIGFKGLSPYINFQELYNITKKTLILTGTNIDSENSTEYFSHLTTPNMSVWLALRITTSFPFFFNIIKYNNNNYMDGGVSSSTPIEAYNIVTGRSFQENRDNILIIILSRVSKYFDYGNEDNCHDNINVNDNNNNINVDNKKNIKLKNDNLNLLSFVMRFIKSIRYSEKCRVVKFKKNILELYVPKITKNLNSNISYKENLTDQDIDKFIEHGYNLTEKYFN